MALMSSAISIGILERMLSGATVTNPIIQIVESKEIRDGRLRVELWDSVEKHNYCMISREAAQRIRHKVEPKCLIRVRNFHLEKLDDKNIIVVLDCEVVASAREMGNEIIRLGRAAKRAVPADETSSIETTPTKMHRQPSQPSPSGVFSHTYQARPSTKSNLKRISTLVPYQDRCTIRARVTNKSERICWKNINNQGTLFTFDVCDGSGAITVKAFNTQCDNYFNLIQTGSVYFISGFQCKPGDDKWKANNHPYELTLGILSSVELCIEPCYDIPEVAYNFVPISEVENVPEGQRLDILAIVKSVGEPQIVNRASDGKPLERLDAYVVDHSNTMLKLTLWNEAIHKLNGTDHPVVLIPNAQVRIYNGTISVSAGHGCSIDVNPDLNMARTLEAWWRNVGNSQHLETAGERSNTVTLSQEYVDFYVMNRIGDLLSKFHERFLPLWNRATITLFDREKSVYKACPNAPCAKKVVECGDGQYLCGKCETTSSRYRWCFLINMTVSDATGDLRCTAFTEAAEQILGVSAETYGTYLETDDIDAMDGVFAAAMFKTFHFKFRCQRQDYRGQVGYAFTVTEATEVDAVDDCRSLLEDINLMDEFL